MAQVEYRIRAPSGPAWLVAAISGISSGELQFAVQQSQVATFFGKPYTDAELIPLVWATAAVACTAILWLLTIYLVPGKLLVDLDRHAIVRKRFLRLPNLTIQAACGDCRVKLTYFSEKERQNGTFKRVVLTSPEHREVLLFSDLRDGEALANNLHAMEAHWGDFSTVIERGPS